MERQSNITNEENEAINNLLREGTLDFDENEAENQRRLEMILSEDVGSTPRHTPKPQPEHTSHSKEEKKVDMENKVETSVKEEEEKPIEMPKPLTILEQYIDKTRLKNVQSLVLYLASSLENPKTSRIHLIKNISIDKTDKNMGKPTCIATYKSIIAIGYSSGIIRTMDYNGKVYETLPSHAASGERVLAMDIHFTGNHLIAAYNTSTLILWDLGKWNSFKSFPNNYSNRVLSVRFMKSSSLMAVASDYSGKIYLTELTKSILRRSPTNVTLGKMSYPTELLALENGNVIVAGADGVSLYATEPEARLLWSWNENSKHYIPYIDTGEMPDNPRRRVLAIARNKIVQLVALDGSSGTCEELGFYVSPDTVGGVWWLYPGLLLALTTKYNLVLLWAENFNKGSYGGRVPSENELAELEAPHYLNMQPVATAVRAGEDHNKIEWSLYSQAFGIQERILIGLSQMSVVLWRLRSWKGFLGCEYESKVWYNIFRVSLKLYSGEFKGLAGLPKDKAIRDSELRVRFKDYLKEFLEHCKAGDLSLIHICRCRRYAVCRSRWSPYH
eukprot:TRINITY_DN7924_c0_g1_i1.p1 TRINITY_DN7924_c0_g1~~TRINITY_DN7924_c0_g1_i1.p1  ORF type:complete len:558 (-),score=114.52 TRINITY_DN7924_c0_g1_i1:12-1685(-)